MLTPASRPAYYTDAETVSNHDLCDLRGRLAPEPCALTHHTIPQLIFLPQGSAGVVIG